MDTLNNGWRISETKPLKRNLLSGNRMGRNPEKT
jgi:hypothetical protein